MAGLFVRDVNLRLGHGTAHTIVNEIWVCGNCAFAFHLPKRPAIKRGPYEERPRGNRALN